MTFSLELFRRLRSVGCVAVWGTFHLWAFGQPEEPHAWQYRLLVELCAKYAVSPAADRAASTLVERLATTIGQRLAAAGSEGVPAEDLAKLALLLIQRNELSAFRERHPVSASTAGPPVLPSAGTATYAPGQEPPQKPAPEKAIGDLQKGQEGFRQGVERLSELPFSERFVITGDITSGIQAATVARSSNLTSTFGRARVNVVARAVPGSTSGPFGEGHLFIQLQAAGGPFDSSAVGGPSSFSPLNDVATRRSRFNEGISRGNVYLGKTFYQQEFRLGEARLAGRAGLIDLADFFDTNTFANNESRQFLNSAMVNSAAYKAGIVAPGIMAEYRRQIHRDWLDGAVLRVGYAVSRTERAFTSPIWTGEVELNSLLGGYRGSWRLGGTLGNVAGAGGVHGIHVSADHWVSRRAGVFGRYAYGGKGRGSLALSPLHQSYSGGIQWRFVDRQDRISALAVGFSQAFPINPDGTLTSERVLETYYRWQTAANFSLTPDFQLVLGSGGRRRQGTQAVVGIRMFFGL